MLTIHLLTKNNEKTLNKTFESFLPLNPRFFVGDYGSTDASLDICKKFKAKIFRVNGLMRNEARNLMAKESCDDWNIWIEPWEILLQELKNTNFFNEKKAYARIINGNIINYDIRIWKEKINFVNPIFESINYEKAEKSSLILGSKNANYEDDIFDKINIWKELEPANNKPFYYQACVLLTQNKYDDFIRISDHYLFLDKSINASTVMTRYYQAIVQLMQYRSVTNALKNLNLCLTTKPLMAEFWCLIGDVYYHLLHKFDLAKEFYENALMLGEKRIDFDLYPMDISKYNKYPKMMINSCNNIVGNNCDYVAVRS